MIDTHAHIHDPKFDEDRDAMLARAVAAGVETIVTIGTDLDDSDRALKAAETYGLHASIGIHPHEAIDAPADIAAAFDVLRARYAIAPLAIGETGLDYYYDHSPRDAQQRVLRAQLAYAREHDLPVIFHQRDATEDFVAILRDAFVPPMRGVIHCFTGTSVEAHVFVNEFGLKLGIGGVSTFKTAQGVRDAIAAVGIEPLILETDCPYLAPIPHRGKRNEPAFMIETAKTVATTLGLSLDETIAATTHTARQLFFGAAR